MSRAIPAEYTDPDYVVGVIRELQWSELLPDDREVALRSWLTQVGGQVEDWMIERVRSEYDPDLDQFAE